MLTRSVFIRFCFLKIKNMSATKEMFLQLRAEELEVIYDHTFTKKEAVLTGKKIVDNVLSEGNVNPELVWSNICRLKEVLNSADAEFRNRIDILEKTNVNGVEFNYVNGGNTVNYTDDEIWSTIKNDLEARTEQLKLAQKQDTFDAYGNQVPKVSTTPRKSSITVKF